MGTARKGGWGLLEFWLCTSPDLQHRDSHMAETQIHRLVLKSVSYRVQPSIVPDPEKPRAALIPLW